MSKIIFDCLIFFSLKNISLEGFLLLLFFENFNIWTTLFSKMLSNFGRSLWTSVEVKSKNYFHFTDFCAKIYSLLTHVRKFFHHWGHTKVHLQKWFQKHGKGVSVLEMWMDYYFALEKVWFFPPICLMYSAAYRFGIVKFWILNVCCCFLQAGAVEKIKTNIQNSVCPNQWPTKDISQLTYCWEKI